MKKIFRRSQMKDIIGRRVGGLEMYKYGMPYRNAGGHVFPNDLDLIDLMFVAVEMHPEVHIITCLKDGRTLNRFETEGVDAYYLYKGNPDPEIEFSTEYRSDDWTDEEREASREFMEKCRDQEFTPVQIAAMNFAMNAVLNKK